MIVGVGVDIVDIRRMRQAMERHAERLVQRIYCKGEQDFCRRRHDPVPYFAVRFAAKEALFKALGTGWARGVTWLDVEVRREERGAPVLVLSGKAREISGQLGVRSIHLSLSHSEDSAVAVVILEK
jgi:holo-[acyl-carrier protein] synthase